jgi:hypothetical protein
LRIRLEIADHAHARALVHGGFHFRRKRNVLHQQVDDLEAKRLKIRLNARGDELPELLVISRQIEGGDFARSQRIGKARDNQIAQLLFNLINGETPGG